MNFSPLLSQSCRTRPGSLALPAHLPPLPRQAARGMVRSIVRVQKAKADLKCPRPPRPSCLRASVVNPIARKTNPPIPPPQAHNLPPRQSLPIRLPLPRTLPCGTNPFASPTPPPRHRTRKTPPKRLTIPATRPMSRRRGSSASQGAPMPSPLSTICYPLSALESSLKSEILKSEIPFVSSCLLGQESVSSCLRGESKRNEPTDPRDSIPQPSTPPALPR